MLPRGFYQRPTSAVARDLLGKLLVRVTADGVAALRITEVEAYLGVDDPACHTFGGRRTPRTETMWGEAGRAYVYLIYGLHHCFNVVTVGEGVPEAVLIRGGTGVVGRHLIRRRRGASMSARDLSNGPGKVCQALEIGREFDGFDLCDYAGPAARWPLRLRAEDS